MNNRQCHATLLLVLTVSFADVLAARKTLGTVKGHILFAGRRASRQFLQRYTGYVEQFGAF